MQPFADAAQLGDTAALYDGIDTNSRHGRMIFGARNMNIGIEIILDRHILQDLAEVYVFVLGILCCSDSKSAVCSQGQLPADTEMCRAQFHKHTISGTDGALPYSWACTALQLCSGVIL